MANDEDYYMTRRSRPRRRKKKPPAATDPDLIPSQPSLLESPTICSHCGAKRFQYEPPGFCCAKGEVKVAMNPPPEELYNLFTSEDENSLHFQKYCRLYNNLFAFSSLGGDIDCQTSKGIYVFKLHGQLYHFLPNLIPEEPNPRYLQLYFYDAEHECGNRTSLFQELREDVVSTLMSIVQQNPYAQFFQSLKDKHIDETTTIQICKNPVLDQRTYNAPTSSEVAGILLDSTTSSDAAGPYIVVTGKDNKSHRIMHYYGCYDPLQYPLIFPHGENGWRPGLKRFGRKTRQLPAVNVEPYTNVADAADLLTIEESFTHNASSSKQKTISCREFYCYLFQIREQNFILETRRLVQQLWVDMYVKLENTRLDFFRNNQSSIRADLYQGVIDTAADGEEDAANVGSRVVLPPSFIGGPRDMRRRYLNAMALVQRFGKPDLFLTMTCNPNWHEIRQELKQGEHVQNRPDLTARIFRAKLMAAKNEIVKKEVFGPVAAYIYVVEFQKHGLPHAHFLIILKPESKIRSPEEFDRFVSAEIPPLTCPYLRKVVLQHMMHGPCGVANPNCPCMKGKNGNCKYSYPKEFSTYTTTTTDGYPAYKRPDTGEVVSIRRYQMDNRWVIPYNPYMLAMFDCHINVEICSTVEAVKYLYKYVYKGHDNVSFNIVDSEKACTHDEIEQYQSGRWVSPPEAAWRIYGFDLYDMHPPVLPLQIHLHNMHTVQFSANESLSSLLSDERRTKTPLTEFFTMNKARPNGPKLLYSEFPEYFVWNAKDKIWTDRKSGSMIGRLTFVNPSDQGRYYLRLLLANIRAPTSYSDLLTVNGKVFESFQEAAIEAGLVEQNDAADQCLEEAVEINMPHALRRLFVTVLIFCHVSNPGALWHRYYRFMSDDFRHRHTGLEDKILKLTSEHIQTILESMGRTLNEFGLDFLCTAEDDSEKTIRDIQDVLQAPIPSEYVQARKQLNAKQKEAYKAIIQQVKGNKPGLFFIDGPGGTGKTFLYCALYAKVRTLNKIVLPTASSGIAAANLPCGRTAHSRFKIPIDYEVSQACKVPKQGRLAGLLKETAVIIWDEASMANKANVHSLDLLLRDIMSSDLPFGGKIVILGGDFRQVLPVVPHKTQKEAVEASIVSSPLWPHFTKFHLEQNMRARDDPTYASYLLALGDGKLQQVESAVVQLPEHILIPNDHDRDPIQTLVESVFSDVSSASFNMDTFSDKAILAPKNEEVDAINSYCIQKIQGEAVVYRGFDTLLDDNCAIYPVEFLQTLSPGGMSPHQLILKRDCPVILLRNIDPAGGLCNGTRLKCKEFFANLILCEIASGWYKGHQTMIPRIKLRPPSSSKYPFQFERSQFPIKLSFAMTINKAQGQTLTNVGIFLQNQCFSHGQLYVALSRARSSSKVKVIPPISIEEQHFQLVRNIVSFEVLNRAGIL